MAVNTLYFFDLSYISTSDPDGFSDNGGYQFDINVATVNITPGATETALSVEDTADATFDDDAGVAQTLSGAQTLNGTLYADGTIIEAEYRIVVRDSLGNDYELQFVSVNNDAYNIEGFVAQGAMPPMGEDLLVVGSSDFPSGTYAYNTSTPACFGPGTRIATTRGQVRARDLRAGDMVLLADGGVERIEMVLSSGVMDPRDRDHLPIRIRAGALGQGLPKRDVILSPQHRVWMPGLGALVPAKALICLPRIGRYRGGRRMVLIHVVLARHAVILADGLPCESFWPGGNAMAHLPPFVRRQVEQIMGGPIPAAPLMSVQAAIARLGQLDDTRPFLGAGAHLNPCA